MHYSNVYGLCQNIIYEVLQQKLCSMETGQQFNLPIRIKRIKVKYKIKFDTKFTNFYPNG